MGDTIGNTNAIHSEPPTIPYHLGSEFPTGFAPLTFSLENAKIHFGIEKSVISYSECFLKWKSELFF